jgi:hypothetical protein
MFDSGPGIELAATALFDSLSSISSNWIGGWVVTPSVGEAWKVGMQFRSPPPLPTSFVRNKS